MLCSFYSKRIQKSLQLLTETRFPEVFCRDQSRPVRFSLALLGLIVPYLYIPRADFFRRSSLPRMLCANLPCFSPNICFFFRSLERNALFWTCISIQNFERGFSLLFKYSILLHICLWKRQLLNELFLKDRRKRILEYYSLFIEVF